MKRTLGIVLGGLVAVVVLVVLLRTPISLGIMRRGLERNMAADPIAALPDGLHVVLCGAGGPLPDPERSGPCVAVIAGARVFVVDAGTGGARNLNPLGVPAGRVDAVFLTHFHSDHIDGLGELALLRWIGAGHQTPLPVFGPTGVADVVDGFDRAYARDADYRNAHHGSTVAPRAGAGMAAHPFVPPGPGESAVVWDRDGVRVTSFRVDHTPVDPAVGYRFEYGDRSLVVSGDTRRSDTVLEQARGADLLVHEALAPQLVAVMQEAATAAGRADLAKIASDIPDYHTTPVEAAEIAAAAGVGYLLFYHVVPPLPLPGLEAAFLDGVSDAWDGPVSVGVDGTRVTLPRDSDRIEVVGP